MNKGFAGARRIGYFAAGLLGVVCLVLAFRCAALTVELHHARAEIAAEQQFSPDAAEETKYEEEAAERADPFERSRPAGERSASEILADSALIAHALGAVDGYVGLNCLEGFLAAYNAGIRVFEADFRMTADGRVVLRHDWRAGWQEGISELHIPTEEEFLAKPILDRYTPLSFRDLLLMMEQYPDVCVVTDTKFLDAEAVTAQFGAMAQDARALGLSYLFDRMIVQVYSPKHFEIVNNLCRFAHYIYTFYQDGFSGTEDEFRSRVQFARENGIEGVTMRSDLWDGSWSPVADEYGVRVYAHTVNDAGEARRLLERGVSGVYSDMLTPADLEGEL